MHGRHGWTSRTEEGLKREVRAVKFGGRWAIESKIKGEESWTHHDPPQVEDLRELLEILNRKWQRRRASYEDVRAVERLIRETEG
jgi:2-iminoacetate synthase ThiH